MASSMKTFKVNIMFNDGTGSRFEYIEAVNPPQARAIAESRFPSTATVGSVNMVN